MNKNRDYTDELIEVTSTIDDQDVSVREACKQIIKLYQLKIELDDFIKMYDDYRNQGF